MGSEYFCQRRHILPGKRILELGAGTGYLSILCAKYLGSAHVIASDGSDDVVNNLAEKFVLNDLDGYSCIAAKHVKWGRPLCELDEEPQGCRSPIDVVLGADITYDDGSMPALVGTLLQVFALYPRVLVFIAATQRNQRTWELFLGECRRNCLVLEDQHFELAPKGKQNGPFYGDEALIRICKVLKPCTTLFSGRNLSYLHDGLNL